MLSQSLKNFENTEQRPAIKTIDTVTMPQPQEIQRPQIQIDDSRVAANYASFCRVTGTPEELIIDFGLNPPPSGITDHPILVTQRIVMNYFTAKRDCMLYSQPLSGMKGLSVCWRRMFNAESSCVLRKAKTITSRK